MPRSRIPKCVNKASLSVRTSKNAFQVVKDSRRSLKVIPSCAVANAWWLSWRPWTMWPRPAGAWEHECSCPAFGVILHAGAILEDANRLGIQARAIGHV